MNNPSLESYCVVVFKYYAFQHFPCDTFADVSIVTSISGKIPHVASFNPIGHLIARFSKKEIENVQSILEQFLTHFCLDWIIFE